MDDVIFKICCLIDLAELGVRESLSEGESTAAIFVALKDGLETLQNKLEVIEHE